MRFTFRLLAAVAVVAGLVGSANAAPIVIDNFTSPAFPGASVGAGGDLSNYDGVGSPTVSNTVRSFKSDTFLANSSSTLGGGINYGGTVGTLTGSFGVSSLAQQFASDVTYAFGNSRDFGTMTNLQIDFAFLEAGLANGLSVTVTLTDADGASDSETQILFSTGSPFSALFNAGGFGLVDLTRLTGINVVFNSGANEAADFIVTNIQGNGTDGNENPNEIVPEPASMVVFGVLALGGLVAARRKLLAKKAAVA